MKTETAGKCETIRLTPAETFVAVSSLFPVLFLDKNALITDVSEIYKSCHGIPDDRTLLQSAVTDGLELLGEFCRYDAEDFDYTAHVFTIDHHFYDRGVFFRIKTYGEAVNMMCLTKNEDELSAAVSLAENILSDSVRSIMEVNRTELNNIPFYRVLALHGEEDDMSVYDAYLITRGFSERLGRRRLQAFSKIRFDGYADERAAAHLSGMCPSSYALAIMAAFSMMDMVSDSKVIDVAFYGGSGALQTEISTEAADLFGISEYAGYLHGLIPCVGTGLVPLARAVLSAKEASLTAEVRIRDGKVSVVLSSEGVAYPAMDFKYDNISERIDKLFDFACARLSLSEFILPSEAVSREE